MNSICVYCGSKFGTNAAFKAQAQALGKLLAMQKITLVYGGGCVGLMGAIADAVLENDGEVVGVLPSFMNEIELRHEDLTEMILVDSMHQRKLKMAELADGFIAMPGGLGTLEELSEILTWVQLQLIQKPVGILNVDNYYHHLIALLDHMVNEALLKAENRDFLLVESDPAKLVEGLKNFIHQYPHQLQHLDGT